jgi:hypothetical protein
VTVHPGGAPAQPPSGSDIWVASASGAGSQAVTWRASEGDWTIVAMQADGNAGVSAELRAGATVPALSWLIAGLFVAALALLALGGLLVGIAVHRAQNATGDAQVGGGPRTPAGAGGTEPVLTGGSAR